MLLNRVVWMVGFLVLSSAVLTCEGVDSGWLVDENFDNASDLWSTDWGAVMNVVGRGATGNALAVKAINGVNSNIQFPSQESGVFKCSFDWQPGNGQGTFMGLKVPGAVWDQYQAVVYFDPVGGHIYTMKGNERIKISSRPLRLGDATSASVYHVVMTVWPRATDKMAGSFQITVSGQEGVIARTGKLPFAVDADKPISMFEVRSIKWNEPKEAINGYLDNLIIENDPEAIPFVLAVGCEKWGHIYYVGKPVTLVGRVRNTSDKEIKVPLSFRVTDYYGREVLNKVQTVTVKAKDAVEVRESLSLESTKKYGLYHVKVGGGAEGARIFANTTFAIIEPPNMKADSFKSQFGVLQYPLHSEDAFQEKIVEQMRDIGIKWLRINFHWNNIEQEKGKLDWDGGAFPMGTFTDLAYKYGMHVMAEVAYTARWASTRAHDERGGAIDTGTFWESVSPKDFKDWENFCHKAAERFKGKVKYYEVWNEPGAPLNYENFNGFWRDSSENFIKIIQHANKGIKSVDPEAKICVGGFRTVDIGSHFDHFVERVLPGAIDWIDVISFHGASQVFWGTKFYDFKILMDRLGRSKMVYFDTESPGLDLRSSYLVRGYLEDWSKGVAKSFGFIYNLPRYGHTSLVRPDYTPDVGTVAFATMTRFLEGAKMEGPLTPADGVRAYSFLKNGERIVVAWSEVPGKELKASVCSAERTFDFQGNPGPKVEPGQYWVNSVPVGNDPVYIFCKVDLDLKGFDHVAKR